MYAILAHGGRQHRVSAGDRLVVDRLDVAVGSLIGLEPVLLTGGDGTTAVGADVDGIRVAVTVVKHLRGRKLRVFKYKAKKRSRTMAGHRSDLTELRVESIVARGADLPAPPAAVTTKTIAAHSRSPRVGATRVVAATDRLPAQPEEPAVVAAVEPEPGPDMATHAATPPSKADDPAPADVAEQGTESSSGT